MTSKEAIEQLRKYNSVGLCGDKTLFEPIEKDLEDYEELLKIMGTPIEKIMKKLKYLEIIKKFVLERTAFYDNGMCLDEYIYDCEPVAKIFREWEREEQND